MTIFEALSAPFDPKAVSWRAQSVSKKNPDAPKAMALAYIDARDVMDRLDEAVGPEGWEDAFVETPLGRIICTIRIKIDGEWVSKSDGAGKTDVEGDKGGISDAFKRAAVKWGIGRYLYNMPSPWVACKLYNEKWSEWAPEGLKELERVLRANSPIASPAPAEPVPLVNDEQWAVLTTLVGQSGMDTKKVCDSYGIESLKELPAHRYAALKKRLDQVIQDNSTPEQKAA
jgi:hypothetical protein